LAVLIAGNWLGLGPLPDPRFWERVRRNRIGWVSRMLDSLIEEFGCPRCLPTVDLRSRTSPGFRMRCFTDFVLVAATRFKASSGASLASLQSIPALAPIFTSEMEFNFSSRADLVRAGPKLVVKRTQDG
jgi:hypothetical protein